MLKTHRMCCFKMLNCKISDRALFSGYNVSFFNVKHTDLKRRIYLALKNMK